MENILELLEELQKGLMNPARSYEEFVQKRDTMKELQEMLSRFNAKLVNQSGVVAFSFANAGDSFRFIEVLARASMEKMLANTPQARADAEIRELFGSAQNGPSPERASEPLRNRAALKNIIGELERYARRKKRLQSRIYHF